MAIKVTCQTCGAAFRSDDSSAGKQASCPNCRGTIQIPLPTQAQPAQEPEIYEAEDAEFGGSPVDDRRPCPMCSKMIKRSAVKCRYCGEVLDSSLKGVLTGSDNLDTEAWSKVRSGLNIIYNCIGLICGTALLLGILAAVLAGLNGGQNGGRQAPALLALFVIGGLAIFAAGIGILVGYVHCAKVPPESGARGLAVGTVVCTVVNILLSIAGRATGLEAISSIDSLVSTVGLILFILFIKRSAAYLYDSKLESSTRNFLIFGAILIAGSLSLGLFAIARQGTVVMLGMAIALVCAIVGLCWYLRLIRGLRTTIDLHLAGQ